MSCQLLSSGVLGKVPVTGQKRGSGKLAVESHFGACVDGCPKTLHPGWLQITDSTERQVDRYRGPQTAVCRTDHAAKLDLRNQVDASIYAERFFGRLL